MVSLKSPILILGAGINGAALARELVLNGVGVVLVDTHDVASGATAYSSRLIHGGLRYLEYGEFGLVRESLAERTRLLQLAPQFVRPLRLFVPVRTRFGGIAGSAARFLGLEKFYRQPAADRGLWLVGLGLGMYDLFARDPNLPRRSVHPVGSPHTPAVDSTQYQWLCAYSDAQMIYPERFVLALLEDARRLAAERGVPFQIHTYQQARLDGQCAILRHVARSESSEPSAPTADFEPAAIINATGAWVDLTLQQLRVSSRRLMHGTKGSHLLTHEPRLRAALAGQAVYAEARDGRPIFLLPFGQSTLVGTTDLPCDGDPQSAVASEAELAYLLEAANRIVPTARLTRNDVDLHYSGVRPLPYVGEKNPGAVTRRHWLESHPGSPVPLYSVIGGKLTTCRSLAEQATHTILRRLGQSPTQTSRARLVPGAEGYPLDEAGVAAEQSRLAIELGLGIGQVAAVWNLCGTRAAELLSGSSNDAGDTANLAGTALPMRFIRHVLRQEWVGRLEDLVERRLLLHFHPGLTRPTLDELADLMVSAGRLSRSQCDAAVDACVSRLNTHFGRRI